MKHLFALGVLALSAFALAAAWAQEGDVGPHEAVVKDMLGVLDQITESLKMVNDEQTATAAKPGLQEAATRWQQVLVKSQGLKPPGRAEKERLEPYAEQFVIAQKKLFGQISRVIGIPGGRELLKDVRSVLIPEKTKKSDPAKS